MTTGLRGGCPACASDTTRTLIAIERLPLLCNVPQPTRRAALDVERGDIVFGVCDGCGHLFNRAFDPARIVYAPGYENALHFSSTFNAYAAGLADALIARHDLRGRAVVEIGCGDGSFLSLLAERGAGPCVGVDPSADPQRREYPPAGVEIRPGPADDALLSRARLILSRQVLEHLAEPREMVAQMRRCMSPDAALFVEVPNGLATLRDLAVWDLIYEHFSYFTPTSLQTVLASGGIEVDNVEESFDGQFLCATGRARDGIDASAQAQLDRTLALADAFASRYQAKRREWQDRLNALESAGKTAVVWGAGSKGITFLNLFATGCVVAAVDINPRKHGLFVAGSGRPIVAPADLTAIAPDAVIVMNATYIDEIRGALSERGLHPDMLQA